MGDASKMPVGEPVGEDQVRAELLAARRAVAAGSVRVHHDPTAARSPALNLWTAEPTLTTRPMISWPGTTG